MAAAAYLLRNVVCVACAPVGTVGRLVTSAAALVSASETRVLEATASSTSVASVAASASLLLLEFMADSWVKYTLLAAACVLVVLKLLVWFDGSSPPADMSMYPAAREIRKHVLAQNDTIPPSTSSSPFPLLPQHHKVGNLTSTTLHTTPMFHFLHFSRLRYRQRVHT